MNIFDAVRAALVEADPQKKCALTAALRPSPGEFERPAPKAAEFAGVPGRPERPELVHPRDVIHRGLGTEQGRAAMVHAVAHIEFNAINLALDAPCVSATCLAITTATGSAWRRTRRGTSAC